MSRAAKLKARAAAGDRDAAQLTSTAAALEAAGLEFEAALAGHSVPRIITIMQAY